MLSVPMESRSMLKKIAVGSLVASVASGLLFSLHYYIAKRLIFDPGLAPPWRGILLAVIILFGMSLVVQPFAERLIRPRFARLLAWPASLWMGFAFYLLVLLGLTDVVWWLAGGAARAAIGGAGSVETAAGLRALAIAAAAFAIGASSLRSGLRDPSLKRVEIPLARWPARLDGFRIVQLSDIHIGPILDRAFARRLVDRVDALAPDLVVITGDLVDGAVAQLENEVAPFGELRARHGVFFVTGNHDHYSGIRSWCDAVRALGIRVLRNERVEIQVGECVFDLVGVDDHRGSHFGDGGGEDLAAALDGRDADRAAVLLAHDPSTFKRASGLGIDLQISGHTHGGQMWPFHYLVRLAIPFVAGRYQRRGAELYVSSGTGFWGPPMRLFAPAELTEITLRSPMRAAA
jgi:predicted MPP superfamily phosphohydrolase